MLKTIGLKQNQSLYFLRTKRIDIQPLSSAIIIEALNAPRTVNSKKSEAGARYRALTRTFTGFMFILNAPSDVLAHAGITRGQLIDLREQFERSVHALSHSFNVCNECSKKLRGRKIRKDATNRRSKCQLCGSAAHSTNVVVKIHSKYTLEEALTLMRQQYPEIYV